MSSSRAHLNIVVEIVRADHICHVSLHKEHFCARCILGHGVLTACSRARQTPPIVRTRSSHAADSWSIPYFEALSPCRFLVARCATPQCAVDGQSVAQSGMSSRVVTTKATEDQIWQALAPVCQWTFSPLKSHTAREDRLLTSGAESSRIHDHTRDSAHAQHHSLVARERFTLRYLRKVQTLFSRNGNAAG